MKSFIVFILLAFTLYGVETPQEKAIEELSKKYIGSKYIWGGNTPDGFDCSGYVKYIFAKRGIKLPRTAYQQSRVGNLVLDDFKKGDLLFFNTDKSRNIPVTHVGVYLEDGKFIHAANKKKGVIISSFSKYKNTFVTAKRILGTNDPKIGNDFFLIALKSKTKVNFSYGGFKLIDGVYKPN